MVSNVRIGVDVGGTNTDVILVAGTDEYTHKLPTTNDPSKSTADGVHEICGLAGVDPEQVSTILHGTTVGTNALIEHEGATTGMITSEGFRDVPHIGRHHKLHTFSLQHILPWQKFPLVERRHRKTVPERIYPPGEVVTSLDEEAVVEAAGELIDDGVESIAVCYLHSYLDTEHENRTKELIQETYPEVFISTSNEVVNQFREFERFTTTAINARLAPVMSKYLDRLENRLDDYGFDAEVLIMQSNGGMASIRQVSRKPVTTLLSGPAAGVLSGKHTGNATDRSKLITFDMGGTSADISVIPEQLLERDPRDSEIGDYPAITPMLDIESIGSGGGSIAWFDQAMGFNVGPKSAGADPGPVCYDRGNEEPTITDAQLVLGRIDTGSFLGGNLTIDPDFAREAIQKKLVEAVDQDRFATVEKAALAVLDVANSNMYQAIREQTMQRGYDPREYTFVAFGGAGPMHATDLADNLDISRVLVPPSPGIASARGLLVGEIKYDNQATISQRLQDVDPEEIDERFEELVRQGEHQLRKDGVEIDEAASFRMSMDCLYEGQGYELNVEFDGTDGDWRSRLLERFQGKHEAEYGHYYEDNPVEVLNLRVTATADLEDYDVASLDRGDEDASRAATTESEVVFGTSLDPDTRTVTRYERSKLLAGNVIQGPAIIDEFDSTVVVNPGWEGTVLDDGTIELTK